MKTVLLSIAAAVVVKMAGTLVSDALWEFLKEILIFLVFIITLWNKKGQRDLKTQNDAQQSTLEETLSEVRTNTKVTMKVASEYAASHGKTVEEVLDQDHALLDSLLMRERDRNAEEEIKTRSSGGRNPGRRGN